MVENMNASSNCET